MITELRKGIQPTDDPLMAAFNEGRLAFMRGVPKPVEPADELDGTPTQAFWLGYMYERMIGLHRDMAVRNYIEHGDNLPQGFNR